MTAGSLEVEGTVGTEEAREELGHSSFEELIRRERKKDCSSSETACPFVPLVATLLVNGRIYTPANGVVWLADIKILSGLELATTWLLPAGSTLAVPMGRGAERGRRRFWKRGSRVRGLRT